MEIVTTPFCSPLGLENLNPFGSLLLQERIANTLAFAYNDGRSAGGSTDIPISCTGYEWSINDCNIYELSNAFLRQDDIVLLEKKDYLANPKRNGYRSLHLIIQIPIYLHSEKKMMKVEVQFRTISMDWWASLEHKIRYKKDVEVPLHIAKELRECAEEAALLDYRMENIQKNLGTYLKPDTQTPEQR